MTDRTCPVCARAPKRLFETTDGLACAACLRYAGTVRVEPAPWRVNATRGRSGREWPGRPPSGSEGAGGVVPDGPGRVRP
jgi:hypothetical protein